MRENKKSKKFALQAYAGKARFLILILTISFVSANFFIDTRLNANAQVDISDLNREIQERQGSISELQAKIDSYNKVIKETQAEAKNLQNQISILQNQIAKIGLDIEATELRIEQTKLEIESLNLQITEIEKKIVYQKQKISEYLRLVYKNDQVSYLEILLLNDSFSDFFDQMQYTQSIHDDLRKALDKLKINIDDLETQKQSWQEKADLEQELKNELQRQKLGLEEKGIALDVLLGQARETEQTYQTSVSQLQLEQQRINADIVTLEKKIRAELEKRSAEEKFNGFGPARLQWPVDPSRGITAYFHDPDYPFRHIFEHPAIDVRAYQGTPIKAPEDGYVARVQFKGDTSYGYVMLIHNEGLSTVFGHVSAVYVTEDEYVSKGEVIALSGATPGTPGAGNLTTGPHLHFEVRLNGIPVNPLEYLP